MIHYNFLLLAGYATLVTISSAYELPTEQTGICGVNERFLNCRSDEFSRYQVPACQMTCDDLNDRKSTLDCSEECTSHMCLCAGGYIRHREECIPVDRCLLLSKNKAAIESSAQALGTLITEAVEYIKEKTLKPIAGWIASALPWDENQKHANVTKPEQ